MCKIGITLACLLAVNLGSTAQLAEKAAAAYRSFAADPALKYASIGLLIADETGKKVFGVHENTGLVPASTLKVVTAATALEKLGAGFVFETGVGYTGALTNGQLQGNLVLKASGDPSLGSWRYASTKNFAQLTELAQMLHQHGINEVKGEWLIDESDFETQATPGGWTFDDMGNYYGAGAAGFNWYENQYDLVLAPGAKQGSTVNILRTEPIPNAIMLRNELLTGAPGSGDQAIIYPDFWPGGTVRGTVPAGVKEFIISGSIAEPADYFIKTLRHYATGKPVLAPLLNASGRRIAAAPVAQVNTIGSLKSPTLDSLLYFFLQKSINLYGEALVKQLPRQEGKQGATAAGIALIKQYWKTQGIDPDALRMYDGSGLSPANRVTPTALVQVMTHARSKPWFKYFYQALPTINGLKMKSGSISGVRAYTGYISSGGRTYTFAFMVNNFSGSSSAIMQKMFALLNQLK
jgi:D-alanyl-D-alanine carboxypeptidase/D-alanyl-D-alanine-endopeptidase (penicillin-binding protein 4)